MKNAKQKLLSSAIDLHGYIVLDLEFNIIFANTKATGILSDELLQKLKASILTGKENRSFKLTFCQTVYFCKHEKQNNYQAITLCEESQLEEITNLQEKLNALEDEFQIVLDHIDDSIFVVNNKGIIIRANAVAKQQFHMQQLVGNSIYTFLESGHVSESVSAIIIENQIKEKVNIITKYPGLPDTLCTGIPYYEDDKLRFVVTCERTMDNLETLKQDLLKALSYEELFKDDYSKYLVQGNSNNSIISCSEKTQNLVNTLRKVANVDSTVLLTGESGVGKEAFAEQLYSHSSRVGKPFIKVNCGAIPETLWESELFGYAPASFTGASKAGKLGYFELANGGTLLLDEISEMPIHLQVKLLRVLQEREIVRVGGITPIPIDVRIIATTNRNLPDEIKKGTFREDLFYRLNVLSIEILPLRERKEDIKYMTLYFIDEFNKKYGMNKEISSAAIKQLENYHWPGNVRELKNLIERLVVMNSTEKINYYDVFQHISMEKERELYKSNTNNDNFYYDNIYTNKDVINNESPVYSDKLSYNEASGGTTISDVKKQLLIKLMNQYNGNTKNVAEAMGVTRSTVNRMLKKYDLR